MKNESLGKVIVFASGSKGGVSKSAGAVNLAGALACKGANVLLIDTDTGLKDIGGVGARSCSVWAQLRQIQIESGQTFPPVRSVMMSPDSKIHAEIKDFKQSYDYIVIDTPGAGSHALRSALMMSDIVYLPMNCTSTEYIPLESIFTLMSDLEDLMSTTMGVDGFRLNTYLLPSRIPSNWRVANDEFGEWYNHKGVKFCGISKVKIPFIKAVSDSMEQGWSLHDIKHEKRSVFDLLIREMNGEREPLRQRSI